MTHATQFDTYANAMRDLPQGFATGDKLPESLRMRSEGRYSVYYAPFDHVTETARVVLVGITPGRVQANDALATAQMCLRAGVSVHEARSRAKVSASFAGPMRANLVNLLDHIGLPAKLGIASAASLWTSDARLVQFTSALRYPVFVDGKNFAGNGITATPFLRTEIEYWFEHECRALPDAIYVPLGGAAEAACDYVASRGALRSSQILRGLPHPSGANAERIAYFLGRKAREALSTKTNPRSIDAGRETACATVHRWH